jgi:hypothetical protein
VKNSFDRPRFYAFISLLQTLELLPANIIHIGSWINKTVVRRVRLVIANFTEEPCFRFELYGCPVLGKYK